MMDIWWIVGGAFVVVLVCILLFRLHAFLTLLLAGFLVGGLTGTDALSDYGAKQVSKGEWTTQQAESVWRPRAFLWPLDAQYLVYSAPRRTQPASDRPTPLWRGAIQQALPQGRFRPRSLPLSSDGDP